VTLTPLPVRHTDPATSREAAADAVKRRTTVRDAVYFVLYVDGPTTLDRLVSRYGEYISVVSDWPAASASSIRTRCSELVRDGLAERVPDATGTSDMGNRALVWRVTA
jgi:hypothetical protein